MEPAYREMTIADYESMIELWKTSPGIGISSADSRERIEAFLEMNGDSCFVAIMGGTIVGTCLAGSDGRRGYLYHLVVSPGERRRGIGSALAKLCLEALAGKGIAKCHLFVMADNDPAIAYYEGAAWERRTDLVVFSKNLDAAP